MYQRNVSAPAVTDSVAAVVKYVVEEAFTAHGSVGGREARSNGNQRDEITKTGPGEHSLWLAVSDSVAFAVKLVVDEVFFSQNSLEENGAGGGGASAPKDFGPEP